MEIATKYQKTPAQVILSHLIALGVSVIPKSNNLKRIEENFDVLFELESVDFEKIDQLMGKEGEKGVRSLEMRDYLGFDNFNEEVEEPWRVNFGVHLPRYEYLIIFFSWKTWISSVDA